MYTFQLLILWFHWFSFQQPNSPMCNGSGTYQCGACACNEKHYGKNCQCDGSTVDSDDYDATCKR